MKIFYPYPEEFTLNKAREIQTIHTCHALARQGCEVVLGAARRPGLNEHAILDYFRLAPHPNLKFVFLPRYLHFTWDVVISFQTLFLHRLREYVRDAQRENRIDLIYTRHLKVAEFCLKSRFRLPLVFESHEVFSLGQVDSPLKFRRLFDQEQFVYSRVNGLVTISDHLKDYLRQHFPLRAPVLRASDGVALDLFSAPENTQADPNLIIYTGSLYGWKGVDTVIKAMRYLPEKRLLILGGTPREIAKKQRLAASWKVSDRCVFRGYVSRAELIRTLRQAAIGVLPNHREEISERFTSPLKLFEYMAAGKIIVASDLPSIREILDEEVAWLCPPASPKSLAEAIRATDRDPEAVKRKTEAARARVHDFSWDRRARTVLSFLEGIVCDYAAASTPQARAA
ncbi:MAG: glycosyltransferase family 4 protein [Verrucomicrobiae bacterium]|nr:glycosyltransferase family 4 protein [Verrucomicrobiae bacterium]